MSNRSLQEQIDEKRREIHTEGYPMSVGELVNLYRDGDLDIHPEFQRIFRWSKVQKSRFIESLLLGIPIPSIFVYQRQDGIWDVIDGLQRLSTIFEFMGILRDHDGRLVEPSILEATDYLPELEGTSWDSSGKKLTPEQQRLIKRASIDIKIITRESDDKSKFDLFERLNTGGSLLTSQEVRNSMLIMSNQEYYSWISNLKDDSHFATTVSLSERSQSEQYDLELILRFLTLKDLRNDELKSIGDMNDFLNRQSLRQSELDSSTYRLNEKEFRNVFEIISDALDDSSFRRYDKAKERFQGGFSVAAFEAITLGVHANLDAWVGMDPVQRKERLTELAKEMWQTSQFTSSSGSGLRASQRLSRTVPFARAYFKP